MKRRRSTRNYDKQSFSTADQAHLPLEALTARYALNLISFAPLHREFLDLVMGHINSNTAQRVVLEAFKEAFSDGVPSAIQDCDDPEELAMLTACFVQDNRNARLDGALRNGLVKELAAARTSVSLKCEYRNRVDSLRAMLTLADEEVAILELFACYQVGGIFGSYLDAYPVTEWTMLIAGALELPVPEVRKRISRGGTLADKGLLDFSKKSYELNSTLFEYLAGLSDDFSSARYFTQMNETGYSLDSYPLTQSDRDILKDTVRNPAPCHLLFYGRPGTGKTELAKTLAAETGRPAFLVQYGSDGDEGDRRQAVAVTVGIAPPGAVIIVDESDVLLNTRVSFGRKGVDKGWINSFMDRNRHKIIWITNDISQIEDSVLRRFSYSIKFKKFTQAQRESVWARQLSGHPFEFELPTDVIQRLIRDYEVDAGGITSALKAAENIFTGKKPGPEEAERTIGRLLKHHETLSGIQREKRKLVDLNPNYDISALNTDLPPAELLSALKVHQRLADSEQPLSANIMFWGLPGTGKTEFAKYIAQEMGKQLFVQRMSDLQSMFVGETEKQIAAAFRQARKENAILFLDEADSLLIDRKTASRSWETSQTNEILTQMENFKGICICCTNLLDHIDEAALRRFSWKVKFLPLTAEGREKLFRKYFHPEGRLPKAVKTGLQNARDLTPGDFKTVWQRQQYREKSVTVAEILAELCKENAYKRTRTGGPIGFAA
ncbi:MAG: AAA family ATPase [Kiritimatiellales bacterium]